MSALGQAVKTYLEGYAGFSTSIPGGIFSDQATQDPNIEFPYAVYQSTTRSDQRLLSGAIAKTTERIQLTVVAETAATRQTTRTWIKTALQAAPVRQTIGSLSIDWWRVEDDGQDSNERNEDGSDDSARVASIEIVGTYSES